MRLIEAHDIDAARAPVPDDSALATRVEAFRDPVVKVPDAHRLYVRRETAGQLLNSLEHPSAPPCERDIPKSALVVDTDRNPR